MHFFFLSQQYAFAVMNFLKSQFPHLPSVSISPLSHFSLEENINFLQEQSLEVMTHPHEEVGGSSGSTRQSPKVLRASQY